MEGTGSEGVEDDSMIPEFRDRAFSSWENMGEGACWEERNELGLELSSCRAPSGSGVHGAMSGRGLAPQSQH